MAGMAGGVQSGAIQYYNPKTGGWSTTPPQGGQTPPAGGPGSTASYGAYGQPLGQTVTPTPPTVNTGGFSAVSGKAAPSGGATIGQPAYEQQQQTMLQGQLAASATEQRQAAINALIQQAQSGSLGGPAAPHVGGSNIPFDEGAARASAFAQAKDLAGQNAHASIKALQDHFAGQGLTGSSVEGGAIGGEVGGARGGVNDFVRQQYMNDLGRAAQISDRNYAGDITQRGQDQTRQQTMLSFLASLGSLY